MTNLFRRSIRLVGLFGLSLALVEAVCWSGAGWAQPASGSKGCKAPSPECLAQAQSTCRAQKTTSSGSAYDACVADHIHAQCQMVMVPCP